jgi:sensor c-di-GMP phosphodiesterase-like protein
MLLIFFLPLAVLGGIIALIVWLVQRSRKPTPVAA